MEVENPSLVERVWGRKSLQEGWGRQYPGLVETLFDGSHFSSPKPARLVVPGLAVELSGI